MPNPEPWHSKLNDFEKMLVIKCLRPDKVTNVMQSYIMKYLGGRFMEPQTSGLDAIYEESSPTTPLIFVLSSGTDPAAELFKFAEKLKMTRKLLSISLGQGQGPKAELMLKQSITAGNWLFFQVRTYSQFHVLDLLLTRDIIFPPIFLPTIPYTRRT
jgi:dynein heavy chain